MLSDQHNVLKNLIFPQAAKPEERFDLSEDDYRVLLKRKAARFGGLSVRSIIDYSIFSDSHKELSGQSARSPISASTLLAGEPL